MDDVYPEVWAGVECSYLNVQDQRRDQLAATGHDARPQDLELLQGLGIQAIRYPVLWGRGGSGDATDWPWATDRLGRLRALGLRPIVGLLHHGFGPSGIDPLAADYPERFAGYAVEVARRFPWVDTFLPVNEPLTTARFGALYGWWEPHTRDHATFIRLLLAQCLAMRAATRALRRFRPDVTIIANEDLGTTSGTPEVRSAVRFDNERRWLTFDLLTGRVAVGHPMWDYLSSAPDVAAQLAILNADPDPPDVLGINHYVTSDRFLDHRMNLYPNATHGGDGRLSYADVESVRVDGAVVTGFEPVIDEAWSRYRKTLALTEVQLAGEPTDQVAWWREGWRAATGASRCGIPIAGVTAWGLFGSQGWDDLLRSPGGTYEPGCFDVRVEPPALTAFGAAVARTTERRSTESGTEGWWRRDERVLYRGTSPARTLVSSVR
jgi:dTDP-4-dehydrorhamnose reductase